ncbi:MAG: sel1 repeat family protein [Verrucomicrobiales bacterium]|nr:sel1 repeat family protein [Verrucomicrobiales bacterium]
MIVKTTLVAAALSAITLVQAMGASALGLNTEEWKKPSAEMVAQVEAMEKAMAAMAKGETPEVTLQQAIDKIRELADKGNDKDALFAMGFLMQQSQQQNALAEAMTYYKRAADAGQLQAMNNYGFILAGSSQEVEKTKEGLDFIKKAAEGGLNAARRNMAAIYLNGLGGEERNPDGAVELLEKAANEGDGQAQFELAQFYLELGGPEKVDDDKAWDWLNKAADSGNPNALATLGSVLFDGKTFGARKIEADPKAAVEKFSKLAEQNVPAGLRTMAELHASGQAGVEKDFPKALEYFSRAAQGNDAAAQVVLAGYYDQGVDLDPADQKIDVAPNAAAALELYRLAARNNVPLALYNVGIFYEEGRAVDQDATKAFAHFLQAAGGGFAPAMQKAGVYYLNGAGTLRDPIAAAGWFNRAAAMGLPEGLLSLGVMAESGMVAVAAESTPAKAASEAYQQIVNAPQVADQTRFEALLRLGGIYFRGALVAAGEAPAPDYENAYKQFKQATELAPGNELAANLLKEAAAKLTPEQIKKVDAAVAEAAAARKAALETAAPAAQQGGQKGAAPAAPRAEPTGQRTAPSAAPATASSEAAAPAAMPAAAAPAAAPAAGGEEKKPGFRLPLFNR